MVNIQEYSPRYKEKILELIENIQKTEFNITTTREQQQDLDSIDVYYQTGNGNFWIALDEDDAVIGTIGLKDIGNNKLILRKMFVRKENRGEQFQVSSSLLMTVFKWAKRKGIESIYLGTTEKYFAAHRFYEKNGFVRIPQNELPDNFPVMLLDTVFYMINLSHIEC